MSFGKPADDIGSINTHRAGFNASITSALYGQTSLIMKHSEGGLGLGDSQQLGQRDLHTADCPEVAMRIVLPGAEGAGVGLRRVAAGPEDRFAAVEQLIVGSGRRKHLGQLLPSAKVQQ